MKSMVSLTSNIKQLKRALEKIDKARIKAHQTAVRVEAYRLMGKLREEIRAGAPGGKSFHPMTEMSKKLRSRRRTYKRNPNKPPLYMFAPWVRYKVEKTSDSFNVHIGFVGSNTGNGIPENKLRYLVGRPQAGGQQEVTDPMLSMLLKMGSSKRKRIDPFFLRKTTKTLKTPARPIIDPFWEAHKREAEQNIIANFERKMRGERI